MVGSRQWHFLSYAGYISTRLRHKIIIFLEVVAPAMAGESGALPSVMQGELSVAVEHGPGGTIRSITGP